MAGRDATATDDDALLHIALRRELSIKYYYRLMQPIIDDLEAVAALHIRKWHKVADIYITIPQTLQELLRMIPSPITVEVMSAVELLRLMDSSANRNDIIKTLRSRL